MVITSSGISQVLENGILYCQGSCRCLSASNVMDGRINYGIDENALSLVSSAHATVYSHLWRDKGDEYDK